MGWRKMGKQKAETHEELRAGVANTNFLNRRKWRRKESETETEKVRPLIHAN
jgi:hypothetical protein